MIFQFKSLANMEKNEIIYKNEILGKWGLSKLEA